MIDISKEKVKIDCPECNRPITVLLKEVANEALIKCNCGQEIRLRDNNGTAKKSIMDINKSFKDHKNVIKKLEK